MFTPGIDTETQIEGWRHVTERIHARGGLILCQLWHVGRLSHPDFHAGQTPLAPSAIGFQGRAFTLQGLKDTVKPRAMTLDEIQSTVEDFRLAAIAAKKAGFDGVEIHGANGYLPAQFLEDSSNQRQDQYGGSLQNRARFTLEITDAAISVWGSDRVSVWISRRNREYPPQKSGPAADTHLDFIRLTGTRGSGHGNLAFALARAKDNLIAPLEIWRKRSTVAH